MPRQTLQFRLLMHLLVAADGYLQYFHVGKYWIQDIEKCDQQQALMSW